MNMATKIMTGCMLVMSAFISPAYAASCPEEPFADKIDHADIVFEGRSLTFGKSWIAANEGRGQIFYPVQDFEVSKIWKGKMSKKVHALFPLPLEKMRAFPDDGSNRKEEGLVLLTRQSLADGSPVYVLDTCNGVSVPTAKEMKILKKKFVAAVL